MHINIAVARSLINHKQGTLKTQNIGNEVLYHLYPTHSIKESFEKYGLKNADSAVFVLIFNLESSTNSSSRVI